MKSHAVKEQINDNTLCVEIEPQPAKDDIDVRQENNVFYAQWGGVEWVLENPIAIGDTVYQGEEWKHFPGHRTLTRRQYADGDYTSFHSFNWNPPQTMPIELADKTFKVVGIEVDERPTIEMVPTLTNPVTEKPIYRDKWFWTYKLEEINGQTDS